jgi:hypothetical protein
VSLILDALRKLERDRTARDRGFLVIAQPSWSSTVGRRWMPPAALLAGAALAGGSVSAALLWPRRRAAAPPVSTLAAPSAAPRAGTVAGGVPLPSAPPSSLRSLSVPPQERVSFPNIAPPAPPSGGPASEPAVRAAEAPTLAAEPSASRLSAGAEGALQLQAVSEQEGHPVAIVSGQLVRVGDRIGSATVVRIGPLEVELETAGQRRVLKF